MARVITFSRQFPQTHPRKGEPTQFVEKIWKSLGGVANQYTNNFMTPDYKDSIVWGYQMVEGCKYHTIRGGNRFKVGDTFSPRVWSVRPYASPQWMIAPELQVKKVWPFFIEGDCYYLNGRQLDYESMKRVAANDGLSLDDFECWFPKKFEGQIICWNEKIDY